MSQELSPPQQYELFAFGTELRRRRLDAGLSLTDLAKLVHYSKSHLSKVETGAKPPSTDLARQCDATLSGGGALARLAVGSPAAAAPAGGRAPTPDGAPDAVAVAASTVGTLQAGEPTMASFRAIFDHMRQLGQWLSPGLLIPQLATQVDALARLASETRPAGRDAAMLMAARFAEYAGWLTQESGDDIQAARWTERAVGLAAAGGDPEMAAYSLVRRGLIALYQHDAVATVSLAQAAQSTTLDPRIQGLAAQREAQGHALAGDYDACMRAIDRAATLLSVAGPVTGTEVEPIIGTTHVADVVAIATGWCLFDLGRPVDAAEILGRELARIPSQALRARARYGARLALAYAASGEPEAACAAVTPVLQAIGQIESATVRADLRDLARALNRWHALGTIRDTRLRLTDALNIRAYPR